MCNKKAVFDDSKNTSTLENPADINIVKSSSERNISTANLRSL